MQCNNGLLSKEAHDAHETNPGDKTPSDSQKTGSGHRGVGRGGAGGGGVGGRLLGRLLGRDIGRGGGRGGLHPEEVERQQHVVERVHGQREVGVQHVADDDLVDAGRHVHLVARAGHVHGVDAVVAGRLRAQRVAGHLERRQAVEARQDVVQHQLHLHIYTGNNEL